jgi:hypothetical protein
MVAAVRDRMCIVAGLDLLIAQSAPIRAVDPTDRQTKVNQFRS